MKVSTTDRRPVLSAGRVYCDLIFLGLADMPSLGREVFARDIEMRVGGGAYITAAHLAGLGRRTGLVGRLGLDPLSLELTDELEASGIDLSCLERMADAGPQVTVAMPFKGERAFLTRRAGAALPLSLEQAFASARGGHLHIAEYATLHERPDLPALARAFGLSISLDPSWDEALIGSGELLDRCRGIDVLLPNLAEAEAMTGSSDPEAALRQLQSFVPTVALKAGPEGAFAIGPDDTLVHEPAPSVPVIDTTGAGDAFNAGFLDAWLSAAPITACLKQGVAQGSRVVQGVGGLARNVARPVPSLVPSVR